MNNQIKKELLIGSSSQCDIVIDNKYVGREHAKIILKETTGINTVVIKDLDSKNGTFVNGKKISPVSSIKQNDEVLLADHKLDLNQKKISSLFKHARAIIPPFDYDEENSITIGKSAECDVFIDNIHVSRKHARISVEGNNLFIEDLDSKNGTFLNGKRITEKTLLSPNVKLADYILNMQHPKIQQLIKKELKDPKRKIKSKSQPQTLLRKIIAALFLNIKPDDISIEKEEDFKIGFFAFIFSSAAWFYIIFRFLTNYRIQDEILTMNCLGYSIVMMFIITLVTTMFLIKQFGFKRGFFGGTIANLPIVIVAIISLVLSMQFGSSKVLGLFPEHPLIIGAYLTIFSQVKLVSNVGKVITIIHFILLTFLIYIFIGPLLFNLFKL